MAYATVLSRDPAATYRQVDMVGRTATADGAGLVQLMFDELLAALRAAAWATENQQYTVRSDRVTRATAILFALEAGLDFDKGGDLSRTLAGLYAGARRTVLDAAIGHDPRPFRMVADNLAEIAQAWKQIAG
jgi:flagellar protein FliS